MKRRFVVRATPGLVVQDPTGERWVVSYADHRSVTLLPTRDNPRFDKTDPVVSLPTKVWDRMFRESGWLAL